MAPTSIPSCCLTPQQKDILINAVKNRPFIWDCSSQNYTEVGMRRSGFSQIAHLLSDDNTQYTGAEMQVEWKKLKDVFNRTLKRVAGMDPNDNNHISWRYWESMQFMVDNEKLPTSKQAETIDTIRKPAQFCVKPYKTRQKNRSMTEESQHPNTTDSNTIETQPMLQQISQAAQKAVYGINNTSTHEYCSVDNNQDVMMDQKPMNLEWLASQIPLSNSSQEDIQRKEDIFSVTSTQLEMIKQTTSAEVPKKCRLVHSSSIDSCDDLSCSNTAEPVHTSSNANLPPTKRKRSSLDQQRVDGNVSKYCRSTHMSQKPLQGSHEITDNTTASSHNYAANSLPVSTQQMDHFDVFGMYMASQLRTISLQSSATGLELKKELINTCLRYEIESDW